MEAFGSTDFSLCEFTFANSEEHRLKLVLQERTQDRKGVSGRWGPAARGLGQLSEGAVQPELSRPVRGAGHTQEDNHGKYQDANDCSHWHPWPLLIAPTTRPFCVEGAPASMRQELHSRRYSRTAAWAIAVQQDSFGQPLLWKQ